MGIASSGRSMMTRRAVKIAWTGCLLPESHSVLDESECWRWGLGMEKAEFWLQVAVPRLDVPWEGKALTAQMRPMTNISTPSASLFTSWCWSYRQMIVPIELVVEQSKTNLSHWRVTHPSILCSADQSGRLHGIAKRVRFSPCSYSTYVMLCFTTNKEPSSSLWFYCLDL